MNHSTNDAEVNDYDDDCPAMTDEQYKIMSLVLTHKGVRGGSQKTFYYQGKEEERLHSLRNIMDTLNLSPQQAIEALKIPPAEHENMRRCCRRISVSFP